MSAQLRRRTRILISRALTVARRRVRSVEEAVRKPFDGFARSVNLDRFTSQRALIPIRAKIGDREDPPDHVVARAETIALRCRHRGDY
jgi:hypothetical protein